MAHSRLSLDSSLTSNRAVVPLWCAGRELLVCRSRASAQARRPTTGHRCISWPRTSSTPASSSAIAWRRNFVSTWAA